MKSQPSERELSRLIDAWDNVQRDPEGACRAMERAVKKYPEFAAGWGYLGLAHMQCGRAKDAERGLLRALELEPDSPGWHLGLSTLYKLALANAKRLFEKAARIKELVESGVEISPDCLTAPPEFIRRITLADLGYDYGETRRLAEKYAKDVLNMTRDTDFTRPAINNLLDIQTADHV